MTTEISVLLTMDCEPAHSDVSEYGLEQSASGPAEYPESRRSIEGYVSVGDRYGYSPTLFVHPEVAVNQSEFLLGLQQQGACLGLHLHPYKLKPKYKHDIGAYPPEKQREIISEASDIWSRALNQHPKYFRGGKYSANDSTFGILSELGFEGGSLSNVGRVFPRSFAVWSGAHPYPHRAHEGFRQAAGSLDFVEVPTLGDFSRPLTDGGDAGEEDGFEWLYVPSEVYDHESVIRNMVDRFKHETPETPVVVTNTHNDMAYWESGHHATQKLQTILSTLEEINDTDDQVDITGGTVSSITEKVRGGR